MDGELTKLKMHEDTSNNNVEGRHIKSNVFSPLPQNNNGLRSSTHISGIGTCFIGRQKTVDKLSTCLDSIIGNKCGHTVLLSGPPGV